MMSAEKDYGVHKLSSADKKMPFHNGVVFANNQGWCVPNREMHNDTELVVENKGLLDRLKDAGYDKYGVALDGNPCGDLPRPRYVAECIALHCGVETDQPVVKEPTPEPEPEVEAPVADAEPEKEEAVQVVEKDATAPEEAVEEEAEPTPEPETEKEDAVKIYTEKELLDMSMDDLRKVGKPYGQNDISKAKLAKEIVKAQAEAHCE